MNSKIQTKIEECFEYLFQVAYNMLGNRAVAEDAVQETVLKFLEKTLTQQNQVKNLRSYLTKATYHYCLDQMKIKKSVFFLESLEEISAQDKAFSCKENSGSKKILKNQSQELDKWLAKLPPQYRLVLHLCYYQDHSYQEIANLLDRSADSVKQTHYRAIKRLREVSQEISPKLTERLLMKKSV